MKASAEKSSTTSSMTATQAASQPFFAKAGVGNFFAPVTQTAAPSVQMKMAVNKSGDKFEQEADKMADKVMRMPTPPVSPMKEEIIRRQTDDKLQKNEDDELQKAPSTEEKLQRKGNDDTPAVNAGIQSAIQSQTGGGLALSSDVRNDMELRFGADFSNVRVHSDPESASLSNQLSARAFTYQNHIFFSRDQYQPGSSEGKKLLAHELTHTIQQGVAIQRSKDINVAQQSASMILRSGGRISSALPQHFAANVSEGGKPACTSETKLGKCPPFTPVPEVKKLTRIKGKKVKSNLEAKGKKPGIGKGKTAPKAGVAAAVTPGENPSFLEAVNQVRTEADKQKRKNGSANKKRKEAEKASALPPVEQVDQSSKEKSTEEMERVGAEQQNEGKNFSAEKFQEDLMSRIKNKGPKTESQAKEFAKKPPIEHFEEDFSKNVAAEQDKFTVPLKEKADPNPKGGIAEKLPIVGIPNPVYQPAPKPVDPKLVTPKPKADQEISLQHESERLDVTMQKNRLSDDQLVESREPSFVETLKIKQETQQKLAEAPGDYRQRESAILQGAEVQTHESLSTELEGMGNIHHKIGGHIFSGQEATETKTEKRQREIKEKIDCIYQGTVITVKGILEGMANKVKEDFANSLKEQTELFNKNVTSRLDSYYSFGKKAKHFFLGEPQVVVNQEDGSTRPLTLEDYDTSSFPPRIKVPWINPEVYEIFVKEKNRFIAAMDGEIKTIAKNVEAGLTAAQNQIQLGKSTISIYKGCLTGDELLFAEQLEKEVQMKFENLEGSINDAREDLLQTLADQYTDNVIQLEKTFNEINDELKKSWIDRAIDFIETVGKTIFQLAELLFSILVRVSHLVWDIIKHPIRFFETLVSGLKQGIGQFIGNIGTYLQEAFWTWITGTTPVKNIRLSVSSGIESLFDLVMQVLNLGPADLRAIVDRVLGKEFMQMVDKLIAFGEKAYEFGEQALEPVTILLTQGPVALWGYIKDTLGNIIQSGFDRIKESVFNSVIEKGLKWIAGFFIPGGGFVKIVKAIFSAFQFVAQNLENIRQFFDSIFDSMEAAVAGRTEGVVSKIIAGLQKGMVLALDFLAKQLGLAKLVDSVHHILQSLRRPIVSAIEWVLGKAKPFVLKVMKKGKELLEKGKEKVIGAGKAVVQAGVPKDPNERLRLASQASVSAAKKLTGRVTQKLLNPILAGIRVRYGLQVLQPYEKNGTWWVRATINPEIDQDLGVSSSATASETGSDPISFKTIQVAKALNPVTLSKPFIAKEKKADDKRLAMTRDELRRQVEIQEAALSNLTVGVWRKNWDKFYGPDGGRADQSEAGEDREIAIAAERSNVVALWMGNNPGKTIAEADAFADELFTRRPGDKSYPFMYKSRISNGVTYVNPVYGKTILHAADQAVGGGKGTAGLGGARENFSIGAQWQKNRGDRATVLKGQLEAEILTAGKSTGPSDVDKLTMKVKLPVVDG